MLDDIIDGKDDAREKELFDIEKQILERDKPNVWNIHHENNMERRLEVDFQKYGIAITEHTGQDLSNVTTFAFYAAEEHLREKFKPRKGSA